MSNSNDCHDFLKEEILWNFKVTTSRKKVWKVELDIFEEFLRICNKYNLKYYSI